MIIGGDKAYERPVLCSNTNEVGKMGAGKDSIVFAL